MHLNPLYTNDSQVGALANSEDTDEMEHIAAIHQGLHDFKRQKLSSGIEIQFYFKIVASVYAMDHYKVILSN